MLHRSFNKDMNMQSNATRQQELRRERSNACQRSAGREALGKGPGDALPGRAAPQGPPPCPYPQISWPSFPTGQQVILSSWDRSSPLSPVGSRLFHLWLKQKQQQGWKAPSAAQPRNPLLRCDFPLSPLQVRREPVFTPSPFSFQTAA